MIIKKPGTRFTIKCFFTSPSVGIDMALDVPDMKSLDIDIFGDQWENKVAEIKSDCEKSLGITDFRLMTDEEITQYLEDRKAPELSEDTGECYYEEDDDG